MIVVKMQGRLGNQLFVYAFGVMLESVLGQAVVFDCLSSGDGLSSPWRRLVCWLKNNMRPSGYSVDLPFMGLPLRRVSVLALARRKFQVFCEKEFKSWDDIAKLKKQSKNLYFDGYWQSERCFACVAEHVRQLFTFHRSLPIPAQQILAQIRNCCAVAVHVRRGDYVLNPRTAVAHNICDLAYYQAAINVIRNNFADACFFVFSDDISWCKHNLTSCGSVPIFVDTSAFSIPHLDLELMMNCRHFIIANSSYSWWAAYLGRDSNKRVVAPFLWNRLHPESHPQCEDWILLPC